MERAVQPLQNFMIDKAGAHSLATTVWGEAVRLRVSRTQTNGAYTMLDYYAPAKFGPPRHVHRQDDELFLIVAGSVLIWTPDEVQTAEAGDTVFLPRGKEHTWKGYGDDPIHLQVIVSPGEFECFIPKIVQQRLTAEDIEALTRVADEAGMDITGPPISDTELAEYLAAPAWNRSEGEAL